MRWLTYFLIFLVICIIWFFITRIWVSRVDLIISIFKKILELNKNDNAENWHTLEEIRNKNKKIK
ncbi:hypothetical protein CG018_02695 [Gemella sp. ND 6198]|nr:hypothetical protein CG018_02695 [Gemella sp. ND 6198]